MAERIRFQSALYVVDRAVLLRLPALASRKLPSRGQVAVEGTFNDHDFRAVLEPDGEAGHWMKVDQRLLEVAGAKPGDTATLEIAPANEWPEPRVPKDLQAALAAAPASLRGLWREITPMARWEWVRWVNETRNPQTRERRVAVTISKLSSGKRRPCCFDLSACTDPDFARSGRLVDLRVSPGSPGRSSRGASPRSRSS